MIRLKREMIRTYSGSRKMAKVKVKVSGVVRFGKYKGHPIISLPLDGKARFPFSFGIRKARSIIKHLTEVVGFVLENEKKNMRLRNEGKYYRERINQDD